MSALKRVLRGAIDRLEIALQAVFGPDCNPMAQLGALGWYCFWIVAVSGLYLYAFFDTGVTEAFESVESLTHAQWWAGGVMRSLHRYASDAMVLLMFVHLVREFAHDRLRGVRWFGWVTGLLTVPLIYACGITGYWLVWDRLAQYVAQTTTEWLDALPLFAEPLARNFLDTGHLSGRFFTLMAYLHIAAPLLLLLFMWVHIQRHSRARVYASRALAIGTLAMFLALAVLRPAQSQPPADLARVPAVLGMDWYYLPAYPLINAYGGAAVWLGLLGGGMLLFAMPWLPPLRRPLPAVVHLDDCNGCGRCFEDCPFGAITMLARTDGKPFEQQADVDADRCVSCGICVGACPTATPFRRAAALVPGIELPQDRLAALRDRSIAAAGQLAAHPRVLVFHCSHSAALPAEDRTLVTIAVPCPGMLPPSFLDFLLTRGHADGVVLAGCREEECYFRLGDRYTGQRIARQRDPQLRERVARDRIGVSWRGPSEVRGRREDIAALRAHLADPSRHAGGDAAWRAPQRHLPAAVRWAGQGGSYALVAALLGLLSVLPEYRVLGADDAMITLSFSHAAAPREACAKLTPGEMARLPINMRVRTGCARERWPVTVDLVIDDRRLYHATRVAAGLRDDGPSTVYRRFFVRSGHHVVSVAMRDSGRTSGYDYAATRTVDLRPAQSFVIDFDGAAGAFSLR